MAHSIVVRAQDAARRAHAGQVDKQGRDYFDAHLAPVATALLEHGDLAVAAGWLHDIVEDTAWTLEMVRAEFGDAIAAAVDAVTRRSDETYAELIERAASDPLGRLVKLADNGVNLAGNDALAAVDEEGAARLRKRYEKARRRLLAA